MTDEPLWQVRYVTKSEIDFFVAQHMGERML